MTVETLKQYTQELAKKITFNTENLYQHTITLRGWSSNDKFIIQILDNNAFDLTLTQVQNFIKNKWSYVSSTAGSNMYGYPCIGHAAGVNTETEIGVASAIYYSTDNSRFEVIRVRNGAYASIVPLTELSIREQKTICIALNNVNKPSVYTVNTNVTYNGSNIGTCNWTLLKYPVDATKYKYEWIGKATCSSVNIPVTGISSNGVYESTATVNIGQPSMMTNFQRNQLRTNMYSQSNWGFWLYPVGTPLMNYLMRPTSATVNGALDITIYGSTVE